MTFGKRTQATGYFHKNGVGIELGGSEHNVTLLDEIKKKIDSDDLIKRVHQVGEKLHSQVSNAASKSNRITEVNAAGTMLWINTANAKDA